MDILRGYWLGGVFVSRTLPSAIMIVWLLIATVPGWARGNCILRRGYCVVPAEGKICKAETMLLLLC